MKIAVVGAGALGSLFAALLATQAEKTGDEIWLVGSSSVQPHLNAIQSEGLRLELAPGVQTILPNFETQYNLSLRNLRLTTKPAEVYPADLALILVKSYRSAEAAQQAKLLLTSNGCALTLQNGLGNLAKLAEEVGRERAAQGVTSLAATIPAPGTVRWSGIGPVSVGLSAGLGRVRQRLLLDFIARLTALKLPAATTENIEGLVWGKLIINCAINPLGALLNLPNGELVARPAAREVLEAAAQEAAAVARDLKIELPYPYEAAASQARLVAEQTAANINSMLADVRRGRPTEIDAINGAIVREAERLALPAPVNRTLTRLVQALGTGT
jgi:2-dehydropantoate 2-reductase